MEILIWTSVIFLARVVDVGLDTFRVRFIIRQKKFLAALTGFVEILIFILIVSRVINDIQHWPYVLAYAGGFATGTLLGMSLSEKLTQQLVQATVISNDSRERMEAALREAGFALTRYEGFGRDGPVDVLDIVCTSRGLSRLVEVVRAADPKAFLYAQELSTLRGGYVLGFKSRL
jgi:uncharacterized protein YebE (UPF0316 family)